MGFHKFLRATLREADRPNRDGEQTRDFTSCPTP
jgi:hypothetical protein